MLPPEDLDAEDFLDDPPLDFLAEGLVDPELAFDAEPEFDFLAEEPDLLPLPFLDFSAAGLPPPDGAPPPPLLIDEAGGGGLEIIMVATCRPW